MISDVETEISLIQIEIQGLRIIYNRYDDTF